jgi:hypothetical protein
MRSTTSPQPAPAAQGLGVAMLAAASFGTSGSFASSLIDAGWSPAGAVTVRLFIAAVALTIPAILVMRGRWAQAVTASRSVIVME